MNRYSLVAAGLGLILLSVGCASPTSEIGSTLVRGAISIESEDGEILTDFSGIQFLVVLNSGDSVSDTLLNARTDVDGQFDAVAKVPARGSYPLVISRNDRVIHITSLVLAPSDTVSISGKLPGLERTLKIESYENRAMATYDRLQRLYGRVATLAYGGAMEQDTIPVLMNQWSDLFWSMRDEYPNTYASNLSAIDAIDVLEGWNDEKVLQRLDELDNSDAFFQVKLVYGGHLHARNDGIESGLTYLDALKRSFKDKEKQNAIDMRRIELMFDTGEYNRALDEAQLLAGNSRVDESLQEWAEDVAYRLMYLIPGRQIPDFSVAFDGNSITFPQDVSAPYFLVEIVLLADRGYQQSYNDMLSLHRLVSDNAVAFYTIPLDPRQATINGFFEERAKRWDFADAGAYNIDAILEKLRVDEVPTRLLVSRDGTLYSRYAQYETDGLRSDINTIIQTLN